MPSYGTRRDLAEKRSTHVRNALESAAVRQEHRLSVEDESAFFAAWSVADGRNIANVVKICSCKQQCGPSSRRALERARLDDGTIFTFFFH
jgi:hypothetical protein